MPVRPLPASRSVDGSWWDPAQLQVDLDDYLDTDANGVIQHVCPEMLGWLGYAREELVGQFIGVLMSSFMSHLHSTVLLPKYQSAGAKGQAAIRATMSAMPATRPLMVFTKQQRPVYINMHAH